MVEQRSGNIINLGSMHGIRALPGRGAYSIAKAGVFMLTKMLAQELASYNIRVNGLAPGATKTEINRQIWENPEKLKQFESGIPLGRWAEPSDMVGAALFLASDASIYVTGHIIMVDGGRSL